MRFDARVSQVLGRAHPHQPIEHGHAKQRDKSHSSRDAKRHAAHRQGIGDIACDTHMREQRVVLKHHADVARGRIELGDVRLIDQDPPLIRRLARTYPWANYPYDYWNLWVKHTGSSRDRGELNLDDLKIGLLAGSLEPATVQRLRQAASELKANSGDEGLDQVLAEIELRVEVELAKAGSL